LSRVAWPAFALDEVLDRLKDGEDVTLRSETFSEHEKNTLRSETLSEHEKNTLRSETFSERESETVGEQRELQAPGTFGRVCIQTLKYPGLLPDLLSIVEAIRASTTAPISVCMNPIAESALVELKDAGVERVGVGLDCATPATFAAMKPGFSWRAYQRFIEDIAAVFGTGAVHLIVGLGDSDLALIRRIQTSFDAQCYVGLFAFTPVRGVNLEASPPKIERYRAIQVARYLISHGMAAVNDMIFENERLTVIKLPSTTLQEALKSGRAFQTSGCPSCNRPMYNERPGGIMYNYPRPLKADESRRAWEEVSKYLVRQRQVIRPKVQVAQKAKMWYE
jgi:biotin synthase